MNSTNRATLISRILATTSLLIFILSIVLTPGGNHLYYMIWPFIWSIPRMAELSISSIKEKQSHLAPQNLLCLAILIFPVALGFSRLDQITLGQIGIFEKTIYILWKIAIYPIYGYTIFRSCLGKQTKASVVSEAVPFFVITILFALFVFSASNDAF